MALKIRMKRTVEAKGRHYFRVVVIDGTRARDGRAIEELGVYYPADNPPSVKINKERLDYWVNNGAQMSDTVKSMLKKGAKNAADSTANGAS